MGLSHALLRSATRRPRCYVVEAPGGAAVRRVVESELDRRGWRAATSPAHADALLVAGTAPGDLAAALDLVCSQLPGPRCRLDLAAPGEVCAALDTVPSMLADPQRQAADAHDREADPARWVDGHDEGHDHEMAPSGIALAGGAQDRDGLEMDELVHPLGPVLDRWPGGLELRLRLHGDVVVEASSSWWGPVPGPDRSARAGWDAAATTLSLLGDERHARLARRLREEESSEEPSASSLHARVARLTRRGVVPHAAGEVLLRLTGAATTATTATSDLRPVTPEALVRGQDLGDARLLLAAHTPLLSGGGAGPQEVGDA